MTTLNLHGSFYPDFLKRTFPDGTTKMYTPADQKCIEETMLKLLTLPTTEKKPGLLLGKIQSGKTRTFIGVTALCFDNGFDVTVVLTKNSTALVNQTCKRLTSEFKKFVDARQVVAYDVMKLPKPVPRYMLQQKLLLVAKKQKANVDRLIDLLTGSQSDYRNKRILLIDDEADNASVGYKPAKNKQVEMATIAEQVNTLRAGLEKGAFLQVTATPYSLFLQNEDAAISNTDKLSLRPAFTTLVPIHSAYVGREYYFEKSLEKSHPASFMFSAISKEELAVLKKPPNRNGFKIETDCLTSPKIAGLRKAIVSFIVGGCIRRWQIDQAGATQEHFSFLLHTDSSTKVHNWQEKLANQVVKDLKKAKATNSILFETLLKDAYKNLECSIHASSSLSDAPSFEELLHEVHKALTEEWVHVVKVNSDKDVNSLLDETGQLNLATPLNIFLGGQYLDRGVTIDRLIGFYYGRAPKRYQQDTVLQHSRMYGARHQADCSVTRFYTTSDIYAAMKSMHCSDSALRKCIETGDVQTTLHFIERDSRGLIIPCSPSKTRASKKITVTPETRILPNGFQTIAPSALKRITAKVDSKLEALGLSSLAHDAPPNLVELDEALKLLDILKETFIDFLPGMEDSWVIEDYRALLSYLSRNSRDEKNRGKVGLMLRTNRNRPRQTEQPLDTPDNPERDTRPARAFADANHVPVLALFKQNGRIEQHWRGGEFWWPVMYSPYSAGTLIYAQGTPNIRDTEDETKL